MKREEVKKEMKKGKEMKYKMEGRKYVLGEEKEN